MIHIYIFLFYFTILIICIYIILSMSDMLKKLTSNTNLLITTVIYSIILLGLLIFLIYLQNKHKLLVGIHKLSGVGGELGIENTQSM